MMLLAAVFVAACLIAAWRALSAQTRDAIETKAKAMLKAAQHFMRDKLARTHQAFRSLFLDAKGELNPAARIAVAHMARFCYAYTTTAHGEARTNRDEMLRREGRRQAYIELLRQIHVNPHDVMRSVALEQDPLAA